LKSPYARQALSYAFPYDALINGIYKGYAKRAYGPIPSTVLGFDPHQFKYEYNLAKAKALFDKAGVKPGTTLNYTYTDPYGPMGELLKASLAQIGINLTLTHLDSSAFNTIFYSGKTSKLPNLMSYSWWPDYNDPFDMANTLIASSQQAPNGNNGGMYHNAQVDALLKDMEYANRERVVSDAAKLQDVTGRQDPPCIWEAEPAQTLVLAKNIKGYIFNPVELRTYYFYTMHRA
jgi:peptide/nickel transport system substrate-binding protein